VGSDTGFVYSLDVASGCVYWSFEAEGGVRSSVSIGPVTGQGTARYAAYFGDVKAKVYAVNAETGELLWTQQADAHPIARVTGAPKLHEGRLYVPVSSLEEAAGAYTSYECCKFRGSVVAYDAHTGEQIWRSYSIAEEPKPTTKNVQGAQQWAPAGGAVWNSPVIDAARGALYVGSGNGYTQPAANDTDSVIAFDLETGKRLWWQQFVSDDAWLVGCPGRIDVQGQPRDPERADAQRIAYLNCPDPEKLTGNVDVDLQALMLHTLPDGRTILLAGQQTGRAYALDPDREGAVLWEIYAGADAEDRANITFGGATDGRLAYYPLLYKPSEHRGDPAAPRPTGGLAAIRVGTGELAWYQPTPTAHCPDDAPRGCSSGQNGAATAMPGIVFSGTMDGMLRANSTTDGRIIWEYDTVQEFETVNAVAAKGGSLNGPAPTVVGGMLFTGSGYAIASGITGNVLLAFGVD
jgi:polyvinyl alcohol dehydrogenase (cytochrome)